MTQRFEIPYQLPSLNEVIAKNRDSRFAGANQKRDIQASIMYDIMQAKIKPIGLPCIVCMVFREGTRRRDVDNVESAKKFILDALVKSGVLANDSLKYVVGAPSFVKYGGDGGTHVQVTIIEHEDREYLRQRLRRAENEIVQEVG